MTCKGEPVFHTSGTLHSAGLDADAMRRRVTEDSILAIQIFDQKKFKKKDQGFLGVINIRIGDVIDLAIGDDGTSTLSFSYFTFTLSFGTV